MLGSLKGTTAWRKGGAGKCLLLNAMVVQGHLKILSSTEGRGGVWKMMTLAEKGRRGTLAIADPTSKMLKEGPKKYVYETNGKYWQVAVPKRKELA